MKYAWLLLIFGVLPIGLLWIWKRNLLLRYLGSLVVIVGLIFLVSIPWEMVSVNVIWYYSPEVLIGPYFFNLPIEELAFYAIFGLLVGTLALILRAVRW